MPSNYRKNRVNESVAQETASILRRVKDPRVTSAFITVTAASVSADLKYAKIYYSFIDGDAREIQKGLESAVGFVRHELAAGLNMRVTPEIKFVFDDSPRHGADISALLKTLDIKNDATEEAKDEQTDV